ncbi:MAG: protein-disulfide reductase DsbD family protein [Dehalococcoidia bacterium]
MITSDPVAVRFQVEPGPEPDSPVLRVAVTIAPGFHVYADPVPEGFVPLSVTVEPSDELTAGAAVWPAAERLVIEDIPDEFWVYHGTVLGQLPLRLLAAARPRSVDGEVAYQACTETSCLLPASVSFSVPLS